MRIYVTRAISQKGLALIQTAAESLRAAFEVWPEDRPIPRDVLLEKVQGIDGLLCLLSEQINGELMDAAGPHLKVISQMAVGFDNIDVPAATARQIPIGNTPGVLTDATADLAFALLLAAARRLGEGERYVRGLHWQTWSPNLLLGTEVHGSTLGIVGLGRIGQAVARRAKGFGMRIMAYNRSPLPDLDPLLGVELVDLETVLRQSDFVSLHCALTPETRHFIGESQLSQMKPTAILINTTRGPVVDQAALYRALANGTIAYAALDVTDPEPIRPDDPLLTLDNIVIVPHIASATVATRNKMATLAAENLIAGLKGERLLHCVNEEVYA